MTEKKFYSDVRLIRIENLQGRAKDIAEGMGLKEGLAILKVSINSLPEYEIVEIKGDIFEVFKTLAAEDNITPQQLADAFA